MRSQGQRKSARQEKRIANEIGGKVQKASGATIFAKGDVRKIGELRVEAKTTSKKTYKLKFLDLLKIYNEAAGALEDWIFQVEFQGQMGQNKKLAIVMDGFYESLSLNPPMLTAFVEGAKSYELTPNLNMPIFLIWTFEDLTFRMVLCTWSHLMSLGVPE